MEYLFGDGSGGIGSREYQRQQSFTEFQFDFQVFLGQRISRRQYSRIAVGMIPEEDDIGEQMDDLQVEALALHQAEKALESDVVQVQPQFVLLVDFLRLQDADN